jgi:hypothetical protein
LNPTKPISVIGDDSFQFPMMMMIWPINRLEGQWYAAEVGSMKVIKHFLSISSIVYQ